MRGRRMGRPGLMGTMARTAVIAGTATAVSGKVSQSQHQKAAAAQQDQAAQQAAFQSQAEIEAMQAQMAQLQAQQAAAAPPPPPAAAPAGAPAAVPDLMEQLTKLGDMKAAGLLSDDEFAAAKAKLLA